MSDLKARLLALADELPTNSAWQKRLIAIAGTLPPDHSVDANKMVPAGFDVESMLRATVPGGSVCDPQQVADAIRGWFAKTQPTTDSGQRWRKTRELRITTKSGYQFVHGGPGASILSLNGGFCYYLDEATRELLDEVAAMPAPATPRLEQGAVLPATPESAEPVTAPTQESPQAALTQSSIAVTDADLTEQLREWNKARGYIDDQCVHVVLKQCESLLALRSVPLPVTVPEEWALVPRKEIERVIKVLRYIFYPAACPHADELAKLLAAAPPPPAAAGVVDGGKS